MAGLERALGCWPVVGHAAEGSLQPVLCTERWWAAAAAALVPLGCILDGS